MTDKEKEIVQALRCTSTPGGPTGDCEKCPYWKIEQHRQLGMARRAGGSRQGMSKAVLISIRPEWCQYVGKQIYFDLAAFGGAKAE